jgi:uncharacterized lipoprotein YehR (DUF1307 family)
MKKVYVFLLTLFCAFALSGCGNTEESSLNGQNPSSQESGIELPEDTFN